MFESPASLFPHTDGFLKPSYVVDGIPVPHVLAYFPCSPQSHTAIIYLIIYIKQFDRTKRCQSSVNDYGSFRIPDAFAVEFGLCNCGIIPSSQRFDGAKINIICDNPCEPEHIFYVRRANLLLMSHRKHRNKKCGALHSGPHPKNIIHMSALHYVSFHHLTLNS